jgi:hypothetical protein
MKTDQEVLLMRRERAKGKTQEQAAARAQMSVRTARSYQRRAKPPSQLKQPRTHRTRPNPFAGDWPWVVQLLERDPALQAKTLFAELCHLHPERYQPAQLRTLQRHIAAWRAQEGPAREVVFEQIHHPGLIGQSDFTHMDDLGITLGGVPFLHLLYHFVLTFSNSVARRGYQGITDLQGRQQIRASFGAATQRSLTQRRDQSLAAAVFLVHILWRHHRRHIQRLRP